MASTMEVKGRFNSADRRINFQDVNRNGRDPERRKHIRASARARPDPTEQIGVAMEQGGEGSEHVLSPRAIAGHGEAIVNPIPVIKHVG